MMGIDTRSQQTLGFYYDTDLWVIDTRTGEPHSSDDDQHSSHNSDKIVKKEREKCSAKANELYK